MKPQRPSALGLVGLLFFAAVALSSGRAQAHKPSDSYLTLHLSLASVNEASSGDGRWDIALRDLDQPLTLDANGDGAITWGEVRARAPEIERYALSHLSLSAGETSCPLQAGAFSLTTHTDGRYVSLPLGFRCSKSSNALAVEYRLFEETDPQHRGLVRLDGAATQTLILGAQGRTGSVRLMAQGGAQDATSVLTFVREGVRHIWGGFDHVLFLLALLLPAVLTRSSKGWDAVPAFRPALVEVARVVTAFTLAHSLTLSLAAFEIVHLPSRLVESAIAVSVVIAAVNNVRPFLGPDRWTVAFALGLLHGFGFSSVLGDLGLRSDQKLLGLFGFNLGVELGQLAIVATFLPVAFFLRRTFVYRRVALVGGSVLIAGIAMIWFFERAFALSFVS